MISDKPIPQSLYVHDRSVADPGFPRGGANLFWRQPTV